MFLFLSYTIWSVTPKTESAYERLHELENQEGFDYWSQLSKPEQASSIIVAPDKQLVFQELLSSEDIESKLLVSNFER